MRLKKGEDRIKVHFKCDYVNFYIAHFKEINEEKTHFSDIIDVTDWDSGKIISEIKKLTEYSIENFDSLLRDDQDFSIPLQTSL
jgi:succinate dehydrogenase flavin-adding protein (antitoxin of CptAB toxin-antitoxin module)